MGTWRKYTESMIREAVGNSTSVNGVLRYLGLPLAGGTHAHFSRTIKKMGIDTSHFVRNRNGAHLARKTAAEILIRVPFGSQRTKPPMLRRALAELGRPYVCVRCGNNGAWQGLALRLHVDHIDGDHHNNLESNLRFLCPNCHSQTENFSGKSRGKYAGVATTVRGPDPRRVSPTSR